MSTIISSASHEGVKIIARMQCGYARTVARVTNRRPVTDGHVDQARETGVSLGLMAQAAAAGPEMTDTQRIFLSQSSHGMRQRMAMLLDIPNRSLEQERELHMIDRGLADIEGREPVQTRPRPLGLLSGLGAASPWLAILGSPLTWIAAGVAAFGVQTARLDHAKHDLSEARQTAANNARAAHEWAERSEHYRQGLIDAAEVAHQAAGALEAERQAAARARAREQRRTREIANVLAHAPEPPAWSLRDDAPEGQPPAATP